MTPEIRSQIEALAEARRALIDSLGEGPIGLAWCEQHTEIADQVVRLLQQGLRERFDGAPALAIVATGGYGRSELAPYSDIDLTILPAESAEESVDEPVRQLFQDIHTAFGTLLKMKVGYAYRLLSDLPGLDPVSRSGLMDARLVAGSPRIFQRLQTAFWERFPIGEFLLAKLAEREECFKQTHDTPLVVEPHLKEGAGGLRCRHTATWLRLTIGERQTPSSEAYDHLIGIRNLLHKVSGKLQDRLSRARQAEIADALGQEMYAMMRGVTEAGLALHEEYRQARERLQEARIPLSDGVEAIRGEARLRGDLDAGRAAVGIAVATELGLRVAELPPYDTGRVSGPEALFAISQGEPTLRNLDRCGLLALILPELTDCRTLLSRDSIHTYTVFEHTMQLVRRLDGLAPGDFYGDLKAASGNLEPLYLAALLHDVGKIRPEEDHSVVSEHLARAVCERWGLSPGMRDLVVWLVREHLTMEIFLRLRDVGSPETIREFAALVQDEERLSLLTLLTYADTNAVSESLWTPAQDTFLRQLYRATADHLQAGAPETRPDPAAHRRRLRKELQSADIDDERLQAFLASLPAPYLASVAPEALRRHMEYAQKARAGVPTAKIEPRPSVGASSLTICAPDSPALLSRVLGVIYALDLRVHEIRVYTTSDEAPVALDSFLVSFGNRPLPEATARALEREMLAMLRGEKSVPELLEANGKDPQRKQQLFTYTYRPGTPGLLEVRAPRGRGMAYRLSRLIAEQGWNIVTARVGQWAGNAAAAFYIVGRGAEGPSAAEVDAALQVRL